ncbi:Bromo adjacent homology domain-containing 1 protein [Trichoplax sp. H2]|nr:Bromo adjacent homology domain-containing 1 protein [Trichoplax sp. H2]|eukprot:RDD44982.1 Bromo adjacent homology domain-containing 1 protein [Trichoplax sp. H2]
MELPQRQQDEDIEKGRRIPSQDLTIRKDSDPLLIHSSQSIRLKNKECYNLISSYTKDTKLEQTSNSEKDMQEPTTTISDVAGLEKSCNIDAYVGLIPINVNAGRKFKIQFERNSDTENKTLLKHPLKVDQREGMYVKLLSTNLNGAPFKDLEKSTDYKLELGSNYSTTSSSRSTHCTEYSNSQDDNYSETSSAISTENSLSNKESSNHKIMKETSNGASVDTLPPRKASVTARAIVSALSTSDKKRHVTTEDKTSFSDRIAKLENKNVSDNNIFQSKLRPKNRYNNDVVEDDKKKTSQDQAVKSDTSKVNKKYKFTDCGPKLFSQRQHLPKRRAKKLSPSKTGVSSLIQSKPRSDQLVWKNTISQGKSSNVKRSKTNKTTSVTTTNTAERFAIYPIADNVNNGEASHSRYSKIMKNKNKASKRCWIGIGKPVTIASLNGSHCKRYYTSMRNLEENLLISVKDNVLLQSGPRKIDLPYIGRVLSIWENTESDDIMITVLWYYRPEQTEIGRLNGYHGEKELLSSRHQDDNSANCIIDKCYVLTFSEYCRFHAKRRLYNENEILRKACAHYFFLHSARKGMCMPKIDCDPDHVYFSRHAYDYMTGKVLKKL